MFTTIALIILVVIILAVVFASLFLPRSVVITAFVTILAVGYLNLWTGISTMFLIAGALVFFLTFLYVRGSIANKYNW